MENVSNIQAVVDSNGFYMINARIDEIANGLGLCSIGLDKKVEDLSGQGIDFKTFIAESEYSYP